MASSASNASTISTENAGRLQYRTNVHEESCMKVTKTPLFFTDMREIECLAPSNCLARPTSIANTASLLAMTIDYPLQAMCIRQLHTHTAAAALISMQIDVEEDAMCDGVCAL